MESVKDRIKAYLLQVQCGLSCHIEKEMSGSTEKKNKTKKEKEEEMPEHSSSGKFLFLQEGKLLKHPIMRDNFL